MKKFAIEMADSLGILDPYISFRCRNIKPRITILMYHRVSPSEEIFLNPKISLRPEIFKKHMSYFSKKYGFLSLDELVERLRTNNPLPEKAAVITFDDGYKDNYLYAYPILQKYNVPATIFLTTDYIESDELLWPDKVRYIVQMTSIDYLNFESLSYRLDSDSAKEVFLSKIMRRLVELSEDEKNSLIKKLLNRCKVEIPQELGREVLLSWEEVLKMDNAGIYFGAHSASHPILTNMPLNQAKREIVKSKKTIEKILGNEVTSFSYPHGIFNTRISRLVEKNGFKCAVSIVWSLINSKSDLFQMGRIGASTSIGTLKLRLSRIQLAS